MNGNEAEHTKIQSDVMQEVFTGKFILINGCIKTKNYFYSSIMPSRSI